MLKKINLGGEWTVKRENGSESFKARVPGDIYGDLVREGKIPDPFYRDNEDSLQWIGESSWIYSRTFNVADEFLACKKIMLFCEGLDTLAVVSINGKIVAETDNMFRTWEWDVKKFLKKGSNSITVKFLSVIPYIDKRQGKFNVPGWGVSRSKLAAAGHAWVRKEPCNFGWDWGIKALGCGIWRSVYLAGFDSARILGFRINQEHGKKNVKVKVELEVERMSDNPLVFSASIRLDGKCLSQKILATKGKKTCAELEVENPKLWWPNGMGAHTLYSVSMELRDKNGNILDKASCRIGLRTLELERKKDAWGESFRFRVNGVPFFAKGANWIPADAILSRMTGERYRRLVDDAASANMNMLRVWGGGIYEDDTFYDACDEKGICVWQDFMFSCTNYPAFDRRFMKNVEAEASDNVKRLRHHACLALWCGNNEVETGGLVGPGGWKKGKMPLGEYKQLFEKLLKNVVMREDGERVYWRGSPASPCGSRRDYNNPACGDSHLWSVWHGKQPFEWYRTCFHRFVSEFGFQSFPEPRTVYSYTEEKDRNITSRIMEHHQRSGIGNTTIIQYMLDWFRLPGSFENTIWLSQILQGMAMKYACEHWRRLMPRCMGTLYWQLNDTWPVASWSSVDYFGRWKALHYMACRFYAPLIVSGIENIEEGTVDIHVTSDLSVSKKVRLEWNVTDLEGTVLLSGSMVKNVPASGNRLVKTLKIKHLLNRCGWRNLLVWLELSSEGKTVSDNLVLFARPKHLDLSENPGIRPEKVSEGKDKFIIGFSAKHPALWCRVELPGTDLRFSDNFFHIRPGKIVAVETEPGLVSDITAREIKKKLKIYSLVDTY